MWSQASYCGRILHQLRRKTVVGYRVSQITGAIASVVPEYCRLRR
jgi:hypothetical protein